MVSASFYHYVDQLLKRQHKNRLQFCKQYKHTYSTLQRHWNSDKLPPINMFIDLAEYLNTTMDNLLKQKDVVFFDDSDYLLIVEESKLLSKENKRDILDHINNLLQQEHQSCKTG